MSIDGSQSGAGSGIDTDRRMKVLERLDGTMEDLYEAIQTTEPNSGDEWRLQLRRIHELGYLSNQYRKLKHDTDLDRMAEELKVLMDDVE